MVDTPLVSVIVRSTDRPTLGAALASIAAQDYPAIEIVVVGASGPGHSPLAAQYESRALRFVPCGERRNRPQAANDGLDAATGEWITFLDDDDLFLADHISGLMAARPMAVAVCPQDPMLTFNLALLYRAQREIDLARRCCDRVVALDANFTPAIRLRAELAA